MNKTNITLIIALIVIALVAMFGSRFVKTVPAGHVGVATLFGQVVDKPFPSGLAFPVNPLYKWVLYDIREDTVTEQAQVPSQDQLQTTIDVSVRFSINESLTPSTYQRFGLKPQLVQKQLIPSLRSTLREVGKTIPNAEDFFQEATQDLLQSTLLTSLRADLEPKGLSIDRILIRSITLPPFISEAIESKKEREQAVQKQMAELERFRTEQEQKIAQAEAERRAAEEQAEQMQVLADARAYEISKLTDAIDGNSAYLQLQAIEALKSISKDPGSKVYFLNGDSPQPLPLMNIGEPVK